MRFLVLIRLKEPKPIAVRHHFTHFEREPKKVLKVLFLVTYSFYRKKRHLWISQWGTKLLNLFTSWETSLLSWVLSKDLSFLMNNTCERIFLVFNQSVSQNLIIKLNCYPCTVFFLNIKSWMLTFPTGWRLNPPYTKALDPYGITSRIYPVNSPPRASKNTVAYKVTVMDFNFARKSGSFWLRITSAPSFLRISIYSSLRITFITRTPLA